MEKLTVLVFFLSLLSSGGFSGEDTLKRRVGIYAGGIYSRAYPKKLFTDNVGKIHSFYVSGFDNSVYYLPGFYLGACYGKRSRGNFFNVLIDFSRHSLEYEIHESMGGPYPQSSSKRKVWVDCYELNYQGQWEARIFRNFYLANSILFHQSSSKKWHQEEERVTINYTNNVYYTTRSSETKHYKTGFEIISGISYRLGLTYLIKNRFSVNAFRNFGFPARPWWGLGLTYYPLLK